MQTFFTCILTLLIVFSASLAMAKSPAERARLKQSSNFETKTIYAAPSYNDAQKQAEPVVIDGEDEYVFEDEDEKECVTDNRFAKPFISAMSSIAGAFIGASVGGSGVGGQVGSVLGRTATGVATNEAIREVCK